MSSLYTYIYLYIIPYQARKLLLRYKLISLSSFHLQFLPITQTFYSTLKYQNFPKKNVAQRTSIAYVTLRVDRKEIFHRKTCVHSCVCEHTIHFLFRLDSGEQGAPRLVLHFSRGIHFCLSTRRNLAQVHLICLSIPPLSHLPHDFTPLLLKRSLLGYVSGFNSGFAAVYDVIKA